MGCYEYDEVVFRVLQRMRTRGGGREGRPITGGEK